MTVYSWQAGADSGLLAGHPDRREAPATRGAAIGCCPRSRDADASALFSRVLRLLRAFAALKGRTGRAIDAVPAGPFRRGFHVDQCNRFFRRRGDGNPVERRDVVLVEIIND